MAVKTDLDRQLAFVQRLRDGYVMTEVDVMETYAIRKVPEFVARVRERTGLDIVTAKFILFGQEHAVHFITGEQYPETAGLQEMSAPVNITMSHALETPKLIEHQDGFYAMWVCPNDIGNGELCSKFHKVDLGDEPLRSRMIRCTQCGKLYRIER